ncbi:MAG: T9SS type A sorting domain-containing protein [Fluviicola sp.]
MKNFNFRGWLLSLLLLVVLLVTNQSYAQLTGTRNIPGDYADLAAAITDLNTQGVGAGGVTFNLIAGNPQTAPAGGYVITATGTLADQITFTGNGNTVTASNALVAGQLFDGIIKIVGGDFITVQGFTLNENAANTTTAAATNNMTEWGIALLYATATNGCQNVSILNNTISLGATYQNAFGVYANSTHTATVVATTATATGATGGNNNLSIKGNTISNVNMGVVVVGPTAAADMNNTVTIGGTTALEGNNITFGLTGTFTGFTNVSGTVNGVLVRNSINVTVSNNTLLSNGTTIAGTLNGIQFPSFSNAPIGTFTQNINNNTISLRHNLIGGGMNGININGTSASVTSSINVNNNNFINFDHVTATATGSVTFINQAGTHFTQNISGNTFTNINLKTTGSVTFLSHSNTIPANGTQTVNNNSIVGTFNKSGAGGTVTFSTTGASSPNTANGIYTNNNFSNVTVTGATTVTAFNNNDGSGSAAAKTYTSNTISNITGGSSAITGISISYLGGGIATISNNTITNIIAQSTITGINLGNTFAGSALIQTTNNSINNLVSNGTGGTIAGITSTNAGTNLLIENNTIHTLNTTAVSVFGISGAALNRISRNKVYNLTSTNTGAAVSGVSISAGTFPVIVNNVIGDLKAPNANVANAISGISVNGGSATAPGVTVAYNSVYLDATSVGATFGTSALFTTTAPVLTLNNNLLINNSTPTGTGLSVAYRRSTTTLTTYNAASNKNSFFAGAPSTSNLIFHDGTTGDQTMVQYQTRLLLASVAADGNSFSETQPYATTYFTSLTGSSADYLKPVNGTATQAESGATNIPGITVDYANVTRAGNAGYAGTGTAPDCGAFEFEGITPAPQITINSISPTGNQCTNVTRTVSANITTSSGTIVSASLAYAINGSAQAPITMVNTVGTTWEGTIPTVTPSNATVTWAVSSTNTLGLSSSILGTSYTDEPLTGVSGSATASLTTVCAGDPSTLSTSISLIGSGPVGTAGANTVNFPDIPLNHAYGGAKTQYIYRASELTAAGFSAGNITSLSYNVTATGTTPLNGFTIDMGHTAQNVAVANVAITSGITNVYTNAAQPVTLGANNFVFSTPFAWDGTSNIVVSFVYSNNNAGGSSATVTSSTASFVSTMGIRADNTTAACLYGATASTDACVNLTNTNATSSVRPLLTFTGNRAPAITSVAWTNGVTPVGTGNPLVVNPTSTTTYTANITAAGCVLTPSPTVTVNVNPVNVSLTPINISCNGLSDGSFSLGTITCGTAPFTYSVDAGAFGAIPTNLTLGAHSVVVKDAGGFDSAPISITITQPAAVGTPGIPINAIVCQGELSAPINASNTGTLVLTIPIVVGTEANSAPGNVYGTVTMPALPAGVTVTSATLAVPNVTANGGSWQSEVRLGFTGAINDPAVLSVGAPNLGGNFNYSRPIPVGTINQAGGTLNLLYWDNSDDVVGADATFGTPTATVTINYSTSGSFSTLTWWNAASGGTNLGSTSPLEAVGTSVLPNTNTPGTYTFYAQGQNGVCSSATRLPVTVTVNANTSSSSVQTACSSYTWAQTGMTYTVSGAYSDTIPNAAGCDSIITLNLTINMPSTASVSQTACSSYTWPISGMTYTTSGVYVDTIPNAVGCDSIITLNLTINQPSSSSVSATACVTYTWAQNGMTYTTSGAYTDTLTNAVGCDSIITLNLVINQPTSSSVSASSCVSYTWAQNGMTYTTSGAYTDTIPNAAGCDSIITLNLVINQPSSSSVSETACTSFTWAQNGITYTTSGAYTDTIPNAAGCDSIITLNLVINQPTTSSVTEVACETFTWSQNGTTYTVSGAYTDTIPNAAGCDSIITLNLTINNGGTSTETASACGTYTWAQDGQTYTASGSYDHIIAGGSANGCDSTITLNLTINAFPTATATYTGDSILTASAGTTYQWIDCGTNTAIAGATAQTFQATVNGSYAVVVTNAAGCSDTSTCVTVNDLGLDGKEFTFINVYPNPTTSSVIVDMNVDNATIELVDAQGKVIYVSTINNGGTIDLTNAERGVYFLRVRSENGETTKRIVKQ